jgi:RimJ/RimL family protein N-acetyltransferase
MSIDPSEITLRPLALEDLPTLRDWVNRPHVAEWWDSPITPDDISNEYLPVINGTSSTKAYIVHLGHEPVGFIQSYTVLGSGDGWWEDEKDPGARGIDQFLADGARLSQGIGTAMILRLLQQLFDDPGVTKVQTDPDPTNRRAIRCYTKAGFQSTGVVDTPDGPAMFMVCERGGQ